MVQVAWDTSNLKVLTSGGKVCTSCCDTNCPICLSNVIGKEYYVKFNLNYKTECLLTSHGIEVYETAGWGAFVNWINGQKIRMIPNQTGYIYTYPASGYMPCLPTKLKIYTTSVWPGSCNGNYIIPSESGQLQLTMYFKRESWGTANEKLLLSFSITNNANMSPTGRFFAYLCNKSGGSLIYPYYGCNIYNTDFVLQDGAFPLIGTISFDPE